MIQRRGTGKIRHLDIRHFHLHLDAVRMNELLELLLVKFIGSDGEPHPNADTIASNEAQMTQVTKIAQMLCGILGVFSQSGVWNERHEVHPRRLDRRDR